MNIMPKKISDLLKHWREKRLKNATDEEKIKAADKLKNPIQILKDLSDEKKLEILHKYNGEIQYRLALTIEQEENILKAIDLVENDYKDVVAGQLKSDNARLLAIEKVNNDFDKSRIAKKMQSDNTRLKAMDLVGKYKKEVANQLESDSARLQAINKLEEEERTEIAMQITQASIKAKSIDMLTGEGRFKVACSIDDPVILLKLRDKFEGRERELIISQIGKLLIGDKCEDSTLKKLYTSPRIGYYCSSIVARRMIQTIDDRLFDEKYVDTLSIDMLEQLAIKPNLQKKLFEFSDKKYNLFKRCLEEYQKIAEDSDWRTIADLFFSTNEYDELIEKIEELDSFDIEKFFSVFQNHNNFGIDTPEKLEQYEEIKKQKCDEIMNSSVNISQKRNAVLQKIFGIDASNSEIILERYGEDIESIADSDEKDFVVSLREIMDVEDEAILKQIYDKCEGVGIVNRMAIERKIKTAYAKQFNEGLYEIKDQNLLQIEDEISKIDEELARVRESAKPEELQELQKKKKNFEELRGLDVKLYDAGVDFKMIITGIAPFDRTRLHVSDFKSDWNQPVVDVQHCCTCYIRNDMLGNAGGKIHYGFSKMQPDCLMASNNNDIYSLMAKIANDTDAVFDSTRGDTKVLFARKTD